ncbi:Arc family DNA-binding protein [Pelagibacterium mangrovi]
MSFSALSIRVPAAVKDWIVAQAEANGRSVNKEIIQLIKQAKEREPNK